MKIPHSKWLAFVFLLFANLLAGFNIAPPTNVTARDNPNDDGGRIQITWQLSVTDSLLEGYKILRKQEGDTIICEVGFMGRRRNSFIDEGTTDGIKYSYQVVAVQDSIESASDWSNYTFSKQQWFHTERINVVFFTLLFTFLIVFFINRAKKGVKLFVRKIAGLLAVEEAVGRATEMGKPILYVPGLTGISDVATIAAMNILGEVAKKIATYDSQLIVPNTDPIVFTVAQEVVKQAYTQAGRPDAFKPDSVYFVTDSQFAYAAAVDGIMTREKPATNFFMGYFYAEALILAETGASTGAVQIAGTDSVMQLPFFIVACDYTLMGEELYAASAYLSREPLLLGGLIGQDWGKAIIALILIVATIIGLLTNLKILNLF
ncbi:MAG: fibronectin type III domain-containing protein [candidate division WOR-3 bacterium]